MKSEIPTSSRYYAIPCNRVEESKVFDSRSPQFMLFKSRNYPRIVTAQKCYISFIHMKKCAHTNEKKCAQGVNRKFDLLILSGFGPWAQLGGTLPLNLGPWSVTRTETVS